MVKAPLLIHIGYHKTATTWMQHRLFHPEHGYKPLFGHQDVFDLFVRPHGLVFDPALVRDAVSAASAAVEAGETGVISSEILSGQPFFGGRESDVLAMRLAKVVPNARILISIRSQMRILPSLYMQYLSRGGTMNYVQFFSGKTDIQYYRFSLEHFKYHRLVRFYQNLFGEERVFVLTNESLRNDRDATLRRLARFSGNARYLDLSSDASRPVGVSYPEYAAPFLRRINHIQTSTLNPRPIFSIGKTPRGLYKIVGNIMKKPPASNIFANWMPVSSYVTNEFKDYFADSNKELAEIVGPQLVLSGYPGF